MRGIRRPTVFEEGVEEVMFLLVLGLVLVWLAVAAETREVSPTRVAPPRVATSTPTVTPTPVTPPALAPAPPLPTIPRVPEERR